MRTVASWNADVFCCFNVSAGCAEGWQPESDSEALAACFDAQGSGNSTCFCCTMHLMLSMAPARMLGPLRHQLPSTGTAWVLSSMPTGMFVPACCVPAGHGVGCTYSNGWKQTIYHLLACAP
eukprot:GHRR01031646.1.p1 GENE.GHRR01031646.1~~GHRR01031646.1.p1  ORF type:complete len:122 (-),score=10.08 GHRR01031646.1:140-505(-)